VHHVPDGFGELFLATAGTDGWRHGGTEIDLFFEDAVSNQALTEFRRFIAGFIERFQPETPQVWQWPRNVET
jgi:hypothetical protein